MDEGCRQVTRTGRLSTQTGSGGGGREGTWPEEGAARRAGRAGPARSRGFGRSSARAGRRHCGVASAGILRPDVRLSVTPAAAWTGLKGDRGGVLWEALHLRARVGDLGRAPPGGERGERARPRALGQRGRTPGTWALDEGCCSETPCGLRFRENPRFRPVSEGDPVEGAAAQRTGARWLPLGLRSTAGLCPGLGDTVTRPASAHTSTGARSPDRGGRDKKPVPASPPSRQVCRWHGAAPTVSACRAGLRRPRASFRGCRGTRCPGSWVPAWRRSGEVGEGREGPRGATKGEAWGHEGRGAGCVERRRRHPRADSLTTRVPFWQ